MSLKYTGRKNTFIDVPAGGIKDVIGRMYDKAKDPKTHEKVANISDKVDRYGEKIENFADKVADPILEIVPDKYRDVAKTVYGLGRKGLSFVRKAANWIKTKLKRNNKKSGRMALGGGFEEAPTSSEPKLTSSDGRIRNKNSYKYSPYSFTSGAIGSMKDTEQGVYSQSTADNPNTYINETNNPQQKQLLELVDIINGLKSDVEAIKRQQTTKTPNTRMKTAATKQIPETKEVKTQAQMLAAFK